MNFSNRAGGGSLDRASFEAAMKAMVAAEGSPIERHETIVARPVPSWERVRYIAVAPDLADRLAADLVPAMPSAAFSAGSIDVLVVPSLAPGRWVPLDDHLCPVAPPGAWGPARPRLAPPAGVGVLQDEPSFKP